MAWLWFLIFGLYNGLISGTGENTFLMAVHKLAQRADDSRCWVCTQMPHSSQAGFPITVIPLTKAETVLGLQKATTFNLTGLAGNETVECQGQNNTMYVREFDYDKISPCFIVKQKKGNVCFKRTEKGMEVGTSTCSYTVHLGFTDATGVSASLSLKDTACNMAGSPYNTTINLRSSGKPIMAPNNTYFVCGQRAYPWLPVNWTGSCFMGRVIPQVRFTQLEDHPNVGNLRQRRALRWYEQIFSTFVPTYGWYRLNQDLNALQTVLEEVANETAEALTELSAEMVAIRTVALQNRMALDMLLAEKGGACALIGTECCTYIPDSSENITDIVSHIKKQVEELQQNKYTPVWWSSWMKGWGAWFMHILVIVIAILVAFCVGLQITKVCIARCVGTAQPILLAMTENDGLEDDEDTDDYYSDP